MPNRLSVSQSHSVLLVGLLAVIASGWGSTALLLGQDSGKATGQHAEISSEREQSGARRSDLSISNIRMAPFSRPRPGRLLAIRAEVTNKGTEPQEARVVASIQNFPDQQSTYLVHVPAQDSRVVQLHVRVPSSIPRDKPLEFAISLNDPSDTKDVILINGDGQPSIDKYSAMVDDERVTTAICMDSEPPFKAEWDWPTPSPHATYELVVAARVDNEGTRRTILLDQEPLPCQLADWDTIDTMVIANNRTLADAAAADTIRRWLVSGGRVWVMLDKIEPAQLRSLLPGNATCEVLDDCLLNRIQIDVDLPVPISSEDRLMDFDDPVAFRRTVQSGGRVTHHLQGYPVATWFSVGRGKLLVTTLDARAWTIPRRFHKNSNDPRVQCNFQMRSWALPIGVDFLDLEHRQTPLELAELDYPAKHIGNPVLSRSFVMLGMATFLGTLVLAAVGCLWFRRLTYFGWLAPTVSLLATIPVVIAATTVRQEAGSGSASLQLVEVYPDGSGAMVQEWMTTYLNSSDRGRLRSNLDGTVRWTEQSTTSDLRRWNWNDLHSWELSSSGWPTGLWKTEFKYEVPAEGLRVRAILDETGLSLHLPSGLETPLEDAVLNFAAGEYALCGAMDPEKPLRLDDQSLRAGQTWIANSLIDDEQVRRDEVYGLFSKNLARPRYPSFPALLGWSRLWKERPKWTTERNEMGAALVVLPVHLEIAPQSKSILIPHWLVTTTSPLQEGSRSTFFNNEHGMWRDATTIAGKIPLRFTLPQLIANFDAKEILLQVQVRAPQRDVRLMVLREGRDLEIAKMTSPLGQYEFRITDPSVLREISSGAIETYLEVSHRAGQSSSHSTADIGEWKVDHVSVSVRGDLLNTK